MNLKSLLLTSSLMGVLAVFGAGCGNDCDDAVDHAEECGYDLGDSVDTEECSETDACYSACYVDLPCEPSEDDTAAYTSCIADCG